MLIKGTTVSVVKTRGGRAPLGMLEMKVFCYILHLLHASKEDSFYNGEIELGLNGCLDFIRLPAAGGGTKEGVLFALYRLNEEVLEHEYADGSLLSMPLFSGLLYEPDSDVVKIGLNDDLIMPMVHMDQEQLLSSASCPTEYSRLLYEFIVEKMENGKLDMDVSLEDVRTLFNADSPSYVHFGVFRERVMDPSFKSVQMMTDVDVSYAYVKSGRKITGIRIIANRKAGKKRVEKPTKAKQMDRILQRGSGKSKTAQVMAKLTTPVAKKPDPYGGWMDPAVVSCITDFGDEEETIF